MSVERVKKQYLKEGRVISYSQVLEALKSGLKMCFRGKSIHHAKPDRFVLVFHPSDRKMRERSEDVFIREITRDLACFLGRDTPGLCVSEVRVEVKSDAKLEPGRIRVELYEAAYLLTRFEQDQETQFSDCSEGDGSEWNAVDILPQESSVVKSILVVDDEPVLCAVLQRMLTRLDYQVVSAHDGAEALKILTHMPFDLVISDLRMPAVDGWTLMHHIKKEYPDLPVVLITGYHSVHTQTRAKKSMADGYISKPFSFKQIKEVVESLLHEKSDTHVCITHLRE